MKRESKVPDVQRPDNKDDEKKQATSDQDEVEKPAKTLAAKFQQMLAERERSAESKSEEKTSAESAAVASDEPPDAPTNSPASEPAPDKATDKPKENSSPAVVTRNQAEPAKGQPPQIAEKAADEPGGDGHG